MKKLILILSLLFLVVACGRVTKKEFFLLNYHIDDFENRIKNTPYPYTVRVRPFDIEKAYAKPNIVYRKSRYELEYYGYRHWAIRPKDMLTDLFYNHLQSINLVNSVVRRLDEKGHVDYEVSGDILAIEEYDSEDIWFAHLALRINITRLSDGKLIYTKLFDKRKQVPVKEPVNVVSSLSEITDYFITSEMTVLDSIFNVEMKNGFTPISEEITHDSSKVIKDIDNVGDDYENPIK